MKDLFSGLLLYEITLLILGVFLFLILCIGLLYYIIKKEQIKKLLLFFILPIVMIGYPSIKEISISKDKIAIVTYQERLLENPSDTLAREKLEEYTEKLKGRASTTDDMIQMSKSNLLLGRSKEAAEFAEKALAKDSTSQKARDLKALVTVQQKMEQHVSDNVITSREVKQMENIVNDVEVVEEFDNLKPYLMRRAIGADVTRQE